MASRYRWRQQLLGSLQGQLQLATYLVVFLGFTGASSVGLLIGQRNLLANDQQLARQSIALCDKAIRDLQDDPAQIEQELLFHSNANTSLWIVDTTESPCNTESCTVETSEGETKSIYDSEILIFNDARLDLPDP